jgi:hypothetical protein
MDARAANKAAPTSTSTRACPAPHAAAYRVTTFGPRLPSPSRFEVTSADTAAR